MKGTRMQMFDSRSKLKKKSTSQSRTVPADGHDPLGRRGNDQIRISYM